LRAAVGNRDPDGNVIRIMFRILDKHVKVASLGENLHVGELELGGIPSAPDLTRDLAEFFNSLLGENRFAETRKTSATFAQPRSTVAIPEYRLSA
jgi:hypothetical protein